MAASFDSICENHFYKKLKHVLQSIDVEDEIGVFSKVRMWDIIDVKRGTKNYKRYQNKIRSKHIDFILVDFKTTEILACIELDDPTHRYRHRKKSDYFKNKSLEAAGVPLLRFRVETYNEEEILQKLSEI